jgi:hypothetical protein
MSAAQIINRVRRRGVQLRLREDGTLEAIPAGKLTDAERAAIKAHLDEIKRAVAAEAEPPRYPSLLDKVKQIEREIVAEAAVPLPVEPTPSDPLASTLTATVAVPAAADPVAWRLYSHRLGRELWVVADVQALAELERDGLGGLPVILGDDLEHLRPLDDATLDALLDVTATWPGTRVADAVAIRRERVG